MGWFISGTRMMTAGLIALSTSGAHAGGPWASSVVYGVHNGVAVYEPGVGTPLTYGPFNPSNALWQDPAAVLGKPNTIDYDDLMGHGPVPGGFAGGPMRRVNLVWPSWQWGSGDESDLGERPSWLDGRRQNGVGLTVGSQLVVEFDEPIVNNPDDGGAYHWGTDLIVHGNAAFSSNATIGPETSMASVVLTGGVLAEPVEVAVAQSADGPWYTASVAADGLFPTQPWVWDGDLGAWSGDEQDWLKPVDPGLGIGDFVGLTAAQAIALYAGSAGGTPIDLDALVDELGSPASLGWARFVRFRDPAGNGGEVCAVVDVPDGVGCAAADVAPPTGVLDLSDISAFIGAFTRDEKLADLAAPFGVLDLADITAFIASFVGGCP